MENLDGLLDLADAGTVECLKAELSTEDDEPATRFLTVGWEARSMPVC